MNPFHKLVTLAYIICATLFVITLLAMKQNSNQNYYATSTGSASAASDVRELTDKSDLKTEVEDSDIPVVIDVSATWCGPCKRMAPHIEKLATEYKGKIKVFKVDADQCPQLCQRYNVSAYPTVIFIKPKNAGKNTVVGYEDYDMLKANVKNVSEEKKPEPATK